MSPRFAGTSNVRLPACRKGQLIVLCVEGAARAAAGKARLVVSAKGRQAAAWTMRFMMGPMTIRGCWRSGSVHGEVTIMIVPDPRYRGHRSVWPPLLPQLIAA